MTTAAARVALPGLREPQLGPLPGVTPVDAPRTADGLPPAFVAYGEHFWTRVSPGPNPTDCWHLIGEHRAVAEPYVRVAGVLVHARRVAYELQGLGPLYRVMLRSDCRNDRCLRGDHCTPQRQQRGAPRLGLAELFAQAEHAPHANRPENRRRVLAQHRGRMGRAEDGDVMPIALPVAPTDVVALPTRAQLLALLATRQGAVTTTKDGRTLIRPPWGVFDVDEGGELEAGLAAAIAAAPDGWGR